MTNLKTHDGNADLMARIQAHLNMLSPHMKDRLGVALLIEALGALERLKSERDAYAPAVKQVTLLRSALNDIARFSDCESSERTAKEALAATEPAPTNPCQSSDKLVGRQSWLATHIKSGDVYQVTGEAINCTNAQDGQLMVIYERDGKRFVREASEFQDKFKATK